MVIVAGSARIEVEKPALAFPKTSGRFHGWLGYALTRRIWIDSKFRERFKGEPRYRYTYEEEFDARESASKIWSELDAKGHLDDRESETGLAVRASIDADDGPRDKSFVGSESPVDSHWWMSKLRLVASVARPSPPNGNRQLDERR
jgi:hypothetical protein